MLIAWHPTGTTGRGALTMLPPSVKAEIEAAGGLVLAPTSDGGMREGDDTGVALGVWFTSDFALADELVACAHARHGIDPRRIYTTGCAAGGLMAGAFTLARSSYVAAAAVNSGGLTSSDAFTLQDPERAWDFLKAHPFGVAPFPYTDGLPSGFAASCRIWPGPGTSPAPQ